MGANIALFFQGYPERLLHGGFEGRWLSEVAKDVDHHVDLARAPVVHLDPALVGGAVGKRPQHGEIGLDLASCAPVDVRAGGS